MGIPHIKLYVRMLRRRVTRRLSLGMHNANVRMWSSRFVHGVLIAVVIFSIIPAVLLSGLFDSSAYAASIGPRSATASTDCVNLTGYGTQAWTTPGNAFSSNNSPATASVALNITTNYIKCTNFGFTLPAGSDVQGITATVERNAGVAARIYDSRISIVKAGSVGATNKADTVTGWPVTDASASYGSTSDLWGESWAYTDINATTFGIAVAAVRTGSTGAVTANVDHVTLTVEYVVNTTLEQSGYRWFNNQDSGAASTFLEVWGGDSNDISRATATDTNGDVYLASNTSSTNIMVGAINDIVLQKYNSSGVEQWSKVWGGDNADYPYAATTDAANNLYITGYTASTGFTSGAYDMIIQKYNSSGVEQWTKTWGSTSNEIGYAITTDTSGNIYVSGYSDSAAFSTGGAADIFVQKYDSTGAELWTSTWGGAGSDVANGIAVDTSGNVYIAGSTDSAGFTAGLADFVIQKYDSTGAQLWNSTWGGTTADAINAMTIDNTGNIYVAGYTSSTGFTVGGNDVAVQKYSSTGAEIWTSTWGGDVADVANAIKVDYSGNVIIGGYTASTGFTAGNNDLFVQQYNSSGAEVWTKTWGGTNVEQATTLSLDASGKIFVAGHTLSTEFLIGGVFEGVIAKFDNDGSMATCSSCVTRTANETGRTTGEVVRAASRVVRTTAEVLRATNETDRPSVQTLVHCGTVKELGYSYGTTQADYSHATTSDSSGNVFTVGTTAQGGVPDALLQKFDSTGAEVWTKKWVGTAAGYDEARGIALDTSGNIFVVGYTDSTGFTTGTTYDITLQKYNSSGVEQWTKTWGGDGYDNAYGIAIDGSDNIYIAGSTASTGFTAGSSDFVLQKYNSSGIEQWTKTWGGTGADLATAIKLDGSGNIFITGYTDSPGFTAGVQDFVLQKYNSSGVEQWTKSWGGTGADYAKALVLDGSGNIFVTGYSSSTGFTAGSSDFVLQKYNSSGVEQWTKTWGDTGVEIANGITLDASSNIYVAGYSASTNFTMGSNDLVLQKYNSSGVEQWTKTWGGTGSDQGFAVNLYPSTTSLIVAGQFVSPGFTAGANDAFFLKTDIMADCAGVCNSRTTAETDRTTAETDYPSTSETDRPAAVETDRPAAVETDIPTTEVQRFETPVGASPIDVGSPLNSVAQNTATTALGEQQIFRLRLLLHASTLSAGDTLKLQYSKRGSDNLCDTSFANETYRDVTTSTPISYANNTNASDGNALVTNANDPTHSGHAIVNQEYNESNNTSIISAIASGLDGMWDFALKDNNAEPNTSYCFRMVFATGTTLTTYSVVPQINTLPPAFDQANYRWYKGQDSVPNNTFVQSWGGAASDRAFDISQTSDGGYVVTGDTASYGGGGSSDMFIAKYDATGALSWSRTWGSTNTEQGQAVIQTKDGGYAVTGSGGGTNMMLVKYDASGTISWDRTWGGTGTNLGYDIIQTDDSGYAITGYTSGYGAGSNDAILVKFDAAGTLSWSRTWGDTGSDLATSLVQTQDQGYVITGTTGLGAGAGDMFIAKFDNLGSLSWNKTWGGVGFESGSSIIQANDGGFAVAGNTASYGVAGAEMFLAKYDSLGSLSWSRAWGGSGDEYVNDVVQGIDGGYTIAGDTTSYGAGLGDVFLTKFNSAGTLSWDKTWGTSVTEQSSALTNTSDGGYAAVGRGVVTGGGGSNDSIVLKYDANGDIYGCITPMCQDPAATVNTPSVTPGTPAVTPGTPGATVNDPAITPTSPAPTVTIIAGQSTFAKSWGGTLLEAGRQSVPTSDGGYAMVGYTAGYGAGGNDVAVLKYDAVGNLTWARTWGGASSDTGIYLTATSDGGFAVSASQSSYGGGSVDNAIIKYTSAGAVSWNRTWGGAGLDYAAAIIQTSDGGYAVVGDTDTYGAAGDLSLVKYDASGVVSWARTWGGAAAELGDGIIQTKDGGYLITGTTSSYGAGGQDAVLVKYDASGNLSWARTWGGATNETGKQVIETTDGGYAITGATNSFGAGGLDAYIAIFDSAGSLVWNKTWGSASSDYGVDIALTSDGGYVVSGMTNHAAFVQGAYDAVIIKYSSAGAVLWSNTWGGAGNDYSSSVSPTNDGGYIVSGDQASYSAGSNDFYAIKYTHDGNIIGCVATMCKSVSGTPNTPSATLNSPSGTTSSPINAGTAPVATSGTPAGPTDSYRAAKRVWSEIVPVPGASIGVQDTAGASTRHDDPLRLRVTLRNTKTATAGSANLKLQVAPRVGTCDVSFTGESYADLSGSTAFNYYDNTNLTTGTWARTGAYDPSIGAGTLWYENYQEAAGFTNRHHIKGTHFGLWDISLTPTDDAVYDSYCFRVVNNDNSPLSGYDRVAEVSIPPAAKQQMRHGKFFDTTTGTKQPFYW